MKLNYLLSALLFLTMLGCSRGRTDISELINEEASIVNDLPFNPLQWKVISSTINKQDSTMSTLYGNDLAVRSARTSPQRIYPPGSVLSLVTWFQQEDKHWFGAKIPGQIKSVEFVIVDSSPDHPPLYSYQLYEGTRPKRMSTVEASTLNARIDHILGQRASVMP
jgi:Cytochrome P460